MKNHNPVASQIVDEAMLRFPSSATRQIAKVLVKENPTMFTFENARSMVNRRRGTKGENSRRAIRFPKQERMPKSIAEKREFFEIHGSHRVLLLSDIHFPFHDSVALKTAIDYGVKRKPDVVYLNGDTMENYGVSRWEPDPRKRDVPEEIKLCREGLRYMRSKFPKARIIYKIGNHDERIELYLLRNAPSLLGIEDFELSALLRFDELGIEQVDSRQVAFLGKLMVLHGHELPKGISNPVNPARGLFLRVNETAAIGHFHQTSQHSDSTGIRKRHISYWSTGCLCELAPSYAIANKWNHGFAFVETDRSGEFSVDNLKIIHGKVF